MGLRFSGHISGIGLVCISRRAIPGDVALFAFGRMNLQPPKPYLPPNDVTASELFLKLMEKPRPSVVVDFPRIDHVSGKPIAQVRVTVLSHEQHDHARRAAHAALKQKGYSNEDLQSPIFAEITGDAVARELLARATVEVNPIPGSDPDKPSYARIFRDADDLSKALSADELMLLFNYYLHAQYKFGPMDKWLDADEVDAWVYRLSQGAGEHSFLALSSVRQVGLLQSLVERISGIYQLLASRSESLPSSLRSDLESFSTAIFSSFVPPADTTEISTASSPDEPITLEQAMRTAEILRG